MFVLFITLASCTKKKKSIIPLFGILAGLEESSSQSTPQGSTDTSKTEDVPTASVTVTAQNNVPLTNGTSSFTITPATVSSTGSTTPTSEATATGAVFSIIPATAPGEVPPTSLSGSNPTVNIISGSTVGENFTYETTKTILIDASVVDANFQPVPGVILVISDGTPNSNLFQQLTNASGRVLGSINVPIALDTVSVYVVAGSQTTAGVPVPVKITITDGTGHAVIKFISAIDTIIIPVDKNTLDLNNIADADGDGVPDDYDHYASDPTKSTMVRTPTSGVNTLSFEDKYPMAGDADLNDYIVHFYNEVDYNSEGKIVEIRGYYQHVALGGTYKHTLNIRLPETLNYTYERTTMDSNGGILSNSGTVSPSLADKQGGLQILGSSNTTLPGYTSNNSTWNTKNGAYTPGHIAKIKIALTTPQAETAVGKVPYDIFLKLITGHYGDHKYYPSASIRSLDFTGKVEYQYANYKEDGKTEYTTKTVEKTVYTIDAVAKTSTDPECVENDGTGSGLQEETDPDPRCQPYTYTAETTGCIHIAANKAISNSYCKDIKWCINKLVVPQKYNLYHVDDTPGFLRDAMSTNYCENRTKCWDDTTYTSGTGFGLNIERKYEVCQMYADPQIPSYDYVEIHLPGKYFKADGKDQYMDSNNFPWGILVPGSWKWPIEGHDIRNADYTPYPKFKNWMDTKGVEDQNWYATATEDKLYPNAPSVAGNSLLGQGTQLAAYLIGLGSQNLALLLSLVGVVGASIFFVLRRQHKTM
jgi:LruC domain-containing protein